MKKSTVIMVGLLMTGRLNTIADEQYTKCKPFKMEQVHLLPLRFQENMKRDSAWMMSIPVNSLLQSFRNTSGAFASREGGYMTVKKLCGWDLLTATFEAISRGISFLLMPRTMHRLAL